MSVSLQPHDPVPSAIAPHLLHSPGNSPSVNLHNFMDAYRDDAAHSPHSLAFPQSPAPDANKFQLQEPHSPIPQPVTSPSGMLVVHSYGPASASAGAELTAYVDFTNVTVTPKVHLRIVFGDLALPTSVLPNLSPQEREPGHERGDWKLKSVVPHEDQASPHMAEVGPDGRPEWPLTLQALDAKGTPLDKIGFGLFVYQNVSVTPNITSPPTIYDIQSRSSNKRPRRDDDEYSLNPAKRLILDTDFQRLSIDESFIGSHPSFVHRTFLNPPTPPISSPLHAGLSIPTHTFRRQLQPPNIPEHHIQSHQSETHSLPLSDVPAVPSSPAARSDDSPALIRTSQLGHDAKPEQASVAFESDLEKIKENWSHTETMVGRRLVQFWKQQIGTTLHISCKTIMQHDYKENTIVVSCIYRDPEYFITSVDVIALLEALAGTRFEVEEKNRIRRNLEGFKPTTISKTKPGTEEFFRIIMELPAPRPRNIEKDVKVFEWGKLKMMMEKVFSKYSTVPIQSTPPKFDRSGHGASSTLYSFPKPLQEDSAELPNFSVPPIGVRHRSQKRDSPNPSARLREVPSLPPVHTSSSWCYRAFEYPTPTTVDD